MTRLTDIFGKRALSGALAALALGAASPAWAQADAYFPEPGGPQSPTSKALSIPVHASIGGSCTFAAGGAPSGTYNAGAIDTTAWTNDFLMTLTCTGPSRMAILSANGGLLSSSTSATGYTNLAPYQVDVSIAQNSGGPTTGGCPAEYLKSSSVAACTLRGTATATVGLPFNPSVGLTNQSFLRVSAPAYNAAFPAGNVLVEGTYNDTLVVTVSPAS